MSSQRQESPEQIEAEAQRWFAALDDPKTTREEFAQLDVWLLDSAHAQAFERLLAPLDLELHQEMAELGIKLPTDS